MRPRDFCLYFGFEELVMPIFSTLIYEIVRWRSRHGLRDEEFSESHNKKEASREEARNIGVRGETYAYWYLRKNGYIFVARNYASRGGAKGELDLVGYDGETLAFVEVRTRTTREALAGLPELSVTPDKQSAVVRTAKRFLAERHVKDCRCRFDVLAIDNCPGSPPEVRLHKDAFSPQV